MKEETLRELMYDYSFEILPSRECKLDDSVLCLFRRGLTKITLNLTEKQFTLLRSNLEKQALILTEIERILSVQYEDVK